MLDYTDTRHGRAMDYSDSQLPEDELEAYIDQQDDNVIKDYMQYKKATTHKVQYFAHCCEPEYTGAIL